MAIFQPGRQMFKGEHKSARGDEARRIAANIAKLPDCWSAGGETRGRGGLGAAVRLYSILFGTWAIKFTPHSLLLI
jgi:hypothetical protein